MNRFYETPLGHLPSVTTILRATESEESKAKLRKWQHKLDKVHGTGTAILESEKARELGTECHHLISQFLIGNLPLSTTNPYFPIALNFLKSIRSDWFELEKVVWSQLGYAGTLDCIAEYYGKTTLIDWKTSSRYKRMDWISHHFLQAEAYAIAYEENSETAIKQLAIVVINPQKIQVFKKSREGLREKWLERLNQFKEIKSNQ